jgi:hypothetical protein
VIVLLADHNIEGQARLLLGTLQKLRWAELLDLRLATFVEVGLDTASSDREVWRRAQQLGMLLLTDNRNNESADSLEETLLEEATSGSLPVVTVGSAERLRTEFGYRTACADRLVEILVDLDGYRGIPRIYVP